MKYQTIFEEARPIERLNNVVRVKVDAPQTLTNTLFLEHVTRVDGSPTEIIIARQGEDIFQSNDYGESWGKFNLGFIPERCFTVSDGSHIIFSSEYNSLKLYSPEWEVIHEIGGFPHPWHGSWSIDESSLGTIVWGEYAYSDSTLSVFRSTNRGLEWEKVMTVEGGGDDPHSGYIRHFHTCQNDPTDPNRWTLSSGDTDTQCRMWSSNDDGKSWTEISFVPKKISGLDNPRLVSPKLWRRTSEKDLGDRIIFPTDDNHTKTGSRLVVVDKNDLERAEIIGKLGPNEVRNLIDVGNNFFVTISESKNDKNSIYVHLCHPEHGSFPIMEIPNELKLKSNGCNSISSKSGIGGVFWTFHDGIAIRKRPKILRWTVTLEDDDEGQNDEPSDNNALPQTESESFDSAYPEPPSPKKSSRDALPFVNPVDPAQRNLAIDELLERAVQDNLVGLPPYDYAGRYITLHRQDILNNKVVQFDEELGIPLNKYSHLDEPIPYPVSVGLYALEQYSKFIEYSDEENLAKFLHACDWIIENQEDEGVWQCPFDYTFFKERGGEMKEGWPSALGQGYCISSLCRYLAYQRSIGASEELVGMISAKIERGIAPFIMRVEDGGVMRKFMGEMVFFEEYPTPKPSFVLNGYIFSLLGLYDAWKTIESDEAANLYREGLQTLIRILPFYDLGDRSAYDLTHLQEGNESAPPNPARRGYHDTHLRLLDAINGIESGIFQDVLTRWVLYRYGVPAPNN